MSSEEANDYGHEAVVDTFLNYSFPLNLEYHFRPDPETRALVESASDL